MYELIQISENDYYIDCPSKIGIVKTAGNNVVLIDSGSDRGTGKIVLKTLENEGMKVQSILLTHSHADHIGGNRIIQERTGCKIFAAGIETAYANFPVLEPFTLYGSFPLPELRCKFLEAQQSDVSMLTDEYLPQGMRAVSLKGHTCDMTGYITADGTFYIGDSLASEENLQKHPVTFITDVAQYLDTLEHLQDVDSKHFVPSHAPVYTDIRHIVKHNIDKVNFIANRIYIMCKQPKTFETLLENLMDSYRIPGSAVQHCLIGSTLKSYLNYLLDMKKIEYTFEGASMLWKTL